VYFRRRLGLVLVLAAAGSAAWLWLAHDPATGSLAGYYGTGTRAAEFLVGCLAAVVLGRPDATMPTPVRRGLTVAGPLALVVLVLTWVTTTDGSAWLYHLGFPAVALVSTVVLVAALVPGPLRDALGVAPLREVGRRSYGIYLFHWPVFVWLTEDRVGVGGTALLVVQLAVVGALTLASFRWLEQPVRTRRVLTGRRGLLVAPVAVVAVALVAVLATLDPPEPELVFDRIEDPVPAVAPEDPTGPVPPAGPVDLLVVGDSMANNVAQGLARLEPRPYVLWDRTTPGCGLAEGERLVSTSGWQEPNPECRPSWRARWADAVAEVDPDVVVLFVGTQEVWDRRVGSGLIPFDGEAGRRTARGELEDAVAVLAATGARVVLVTLPAADWSNWGLVLADPDRSVNNPDWVARWNEVVRDVVEDHPDSVVLADLAELLTPEGTFTAERDGITVRAADGLHLSLEGQDLTARWLTDLLVAELDLTEPPDAVVEVAPAPSGG
jgi:lysophospholipase L1-like esterase